eukprot:NODE_455_length_8260_cov_0.408406.p4 type:complete len:108 gc:universal NODE_455_length_8260_cov_0.408406:1304-1627(+)
MQSYLSRNCLGQSAIKSTVFKSSSEGNIGLTLGIFNIRFFSSFFMFPICFELILIALTCIDFLKTSLLSVNVMYSIKGFPIKLNSKNRIPNLRCNRIAKRQHSKCNE